MHLSHLKLGSVREGIFRAGGAFSTRCFISAKRTPESRNQRRHIAQVIAYVGAIPIRVSAILAGVFATVIMNTLSGVFRVLAPSFPVIDTSGCSL